MMLWKQKGFITIKSGQVKEFLDALLVPREMAIIKIEAHGNRDNMEVKGNGLADHFAKQAALTKVMILTNLQRINLWTEKEAIIKYPHLGLIWKRKNGKNGVYPSLR